LRDFLLRGLVLFGATAAILTELLSPFHLLRRGPLLAAWLIVALVAVIRLPRPKFRRPKFRPFETAATAVILALATAIAIAAWLSPPNSADTMAYHMPRVVYWAQSGSVAFFPTAYFNQVMLPPFDEYLMLHTYVISGGDHFINLLTFAAWLFNVVAISSLAGALGLSSRGQAIAALFCATLPGGILQASGAKNDVLVTLWLVLMVYFALRRNAPLAGLALGLAVATKSTAYLVAPPLLALTMLPRTWRTAAFLVLGILAINTPQYVRNVRLSGSPLGYDSAHGDGVFRWRNEHPGWRSTVSNLIRNTTEQLGGRSERRNRAIFDAAVRLHHALGLNPQDPDTTWHDSVYVPPRDANHEANANNRWHLLFIVIAIAAAAIRRRTDWLLNAAALVAGFLLFCFFLKWQPYMSRLELPFFVLAAPLAGFLLEWVRPRAAAVLACMFLVSTARLPALQNWTRPLQGRASLFHTSRDDDYFSDMVQWNNRESYLEAVARVAASGCETVRIEIRENPLEYPFQALLRERRPHVRFTHVGPACAVLCLDCAGKRETSPGTITIGRFLLDFPEQLHQP
jgi:hypothetical protein